jgi:hypothetical protein
VFFVKAEEIDWIEAADAIMKDGTQLKLSRSRREQLESLLRYLS